MTIYYSDDRVTLHHGYALDVLRTLPDASVDAVVTDPPYGLEFMGKEWDGADGFRRSMNPNDAGRDDPFGRASRTSPEYRTTSKAAAGMSSTGYTDGANRIDRPSHMGGLNPKCRNCDRWQRGGNPCRCDAPDFPNERLPRLHTFQQWCEEWAAECLRVLKPGGHLLAFGGTRTWHRLACAVEDAGFEVRDSIAWLYGSGFSKSWNFKTMYKGEWCSCTTENALPYNHADNPDLPRVRDDIHPPALARSEGENGLLLPEVQRGGEGSGLGEARAQGPRSMVAGSGSLGGGEDDWRAEPGMGGRFVHRAGQGLPDDSEAGSPAGASERLRGRAPARDGGADRAASDATRGGASHQRRPGGQPTGEPEALPGSHVALDDGALRDGAVCARCGGLDQVYQGFGTGIKPAFEPVVVARKPLAGTVAANVTTHGTGALNIDGCRIEGEPVSTTRNTALGVMNDDGWQPTPGTYTTPAGGRWPANVILDEDMAGVLDEQSGTFKGRVGMTQHGSGTNRVYGKFERTEQSTGGAGVEDTGGASRFFYVAKAPKKERPVVDGVAHPTVKPLALMRWLVRLVTPPGGTVLEPFAGSGTTVEACLLEGFQCIAIEKGDEYLPLILERINRQARARVEAEVVRKPDPARAIAEQVAGQLDIFGEATA